jgi:hypothetical protein
MNNAQQAFGKWWDVATARDKDGKMYIPSARDTFMAGRASSALVYSDKVPSEPGWYGWQDYVEGMIKIEALDNGELFVDQEACSIEHFIEDHPTAKFTQRIFLPGEQKEKGA